MTDQPISRPALKAAIQHLLVSNPNDFFAILREVRDDMHAGGHVTPAPTEGDKVRAEVETDLAVLADFFRGFA